MSEGSPNRRLQHRRPGRERHLWRESRRDEPQVRRGEGLHPLRDEGVVAPPYLVPRTDALEDAARRRQVGQVPPAVAHDSAVPIDGQQRTRWLALFVPCVETPCGRLDHLRDPYERHDGEPHLAQHVGVGRHCPWAHPRVTRCFGEAAHPLEPPLVGVGRAVRDACVSRLGRVDHHPLQDLGPVREERVRRVVLREPLGDVERRSRPRLRGRLGLRRRAARPWLCLDLVVDPRRAALVLDAARRAARHRQPRHLRREGRARGQAAGRSACHRRQPPPACLALGCDVPWRAPRRLQCRHRW